MVILECRFTDKAALLKAHVQRHARDIAPLLPAGRSDSRSPYAADWRMRINAEFEAEA